MYIRCRYIVWINFRKFQEIRKYSFWTTRRYVGMVGMWYLSKHFFPVLIYRYPFINMKKSLEQYSFENHILTFLQSGCCGGWEFFFFT